MRKIKFRFYDNKVKEMIVPTKNERKDIILEKWEFNPKASELMQYTGLKDKNGKEIYEGDILKRGAFPDEKPEFIVRFGQFTDSPDFYHELEHSGWYVERIGKRDKYNTSLVYVIEMLDGIVCGNIYEGDNQ
ncbi:YopX family protein [Jeotgalicoccus psychrophilus]|uniref:YopX family protein n=1 Tax=Jeotgalicoccus psychrophilus TaxID=157228 RepID=UPI000687181B|nr:YopX family protein [Jeotgalicoccus psychrophilus]